MKMQRVKAGEYVVIAAPRQVGTVLLTEMDGKKWWRLEIGDPSDPENWRVVYHRNRASVKQMLEELG